MKAFVTILMGVCFCLSIKQNHSYEYCLVQDGEKPLCDDPQVHIACDPDQIESAGEIVGVVPMTPKLKRIIVHVHNAYRNNTACGAIEVDGNKYTKATRMRRLIWEDELSYIATVHAKRCNFVHDKCRTTRRHPVAGQNLARMGSYTKYKIIEVCESSVRMWYEEYLKTTDVPGFAALFPVDQLMEIGHFSQVVNDRTSRVGCGIAVCSKPEEKGILYYHMTCNYDYSNMYGEMVYDDKGEMGSKCGDWGTELSTEYECLCENSGEIFKN